MCGIRSNHSHFKQWDSLVKGADRVIYWYALSIDCSMRRDTHGEHQLIKTGKGRAKRECLWGETAENGNTET